jgi:hypothetical protein
MNAASRPEARTSPSLDVIEAGRRFFQQDPSRILAVAAHLRGPGRTVESTVLGVSMGRTIPAGSRIRIELVTPRRHERGEVIAFVAGHHLIVHRVVRPAPRWPHDHALTRGDAAWIPDPPVDAERVLGAVIAIQRDGLWTSVDEPAAGPWLTRVLAAAVLGVVGCALRVGPGAADALVTLLHRARFLRPEGPSRVRLTDQP